MVSIFNYGFDIAGAAFQQAGVKLVSLTNYSNMIGLAMEKGNVSQGMEKILIDWQKDPANWSR
jgi:orotate phosphoribosyltransferase